MEDMLYYVLDKYEKQINYWFGWTPPGNTYKKDLTISFFADSEELVDSINPEKQNLLKYGNYNVKIIQDYSIKEKNGQPISDLSYCEVEGHKFIKVVTPFTMERAYDFIIGKSDDMLEILRVLKERESNKHFKYNATLPTIGIDYEPIEEETIKFLMNDEFRDYCTEHYIKLKRGIVLAGAPGTGKTRTLQYIRHQAEINKIKYRQFKSVKEFVESIDEYYEESKKIFVFEDFDAALLERDETGKTPSQILGLILNTLEGVEEINDVVSIFTTNHIDTFDKAFLRPGRIDKVFKYELPGHKEILAFFEAYIPKEKEFHLWMTEKVNHLSTNVSYAILKGICDNINIYKFSNVEINDEVINKIIKQTVTAANKEEDVKDAKEYIL